MLPFSFSESKEKHDLTDSPISRDDEFIKLFLCLLFHKSNTKKEGSLWNNSDGNVNCNVFKANS